jgi:hypothetical protein
MNTIDFTMEHVGLNLPDAERPIEGALAFLASRSRKSARHLAAPAGDMFNSFAGAIDQILLGIIEKRTAEEFSSQFAEVFPKYAVMMLALSRVAKVIVPSDALERLTRESICELESDFRDKALSAFGASVRDQAMFTVWTLRKINDLLTQIASVKLDDAKRKEDKGYSFHFNMTSLEAHFSLDCLNMALRMNQPIYPEVMERLKDGLRAIVNAYAWARRGAELRFPIQPALDSNAYTDEEEDEELLLSSMQDMAAMECDEA